MSFSINPNAFVRMLAPALNALPIPSAAKAALQSVAGSITDGFSGNTSGGLQNIGSNLLSPFSALGGNIGNLAQQIISSASQRQVAGIGNLTTPSVADRYNSSQYASTVGQSYSSYDPTAGLVVPPMPSAAGRDLKDPNVAAKYQEEWSVYTALAQLQSTITKMQDDLRKFIISKF